MGEIQVLTMTLRKSLSPPCSPRKVSLVLFRTHRAADELRTEHLHSIGYHLKVPHIDVAILWGLWQETVMSPCLSEPWPSPLSTLMSLLTIGCIPLPQPTRCHHSPWLLPCCPTTCCCLSPPLPCHTTPAHRSLQLSTGSHMTMCI